MLKSLDHLIITVNDLNKSKQFYSNLFGFPPIWEGKHEGLGTKNALFLLENMYLELLTKDGEGIGADFVENQIKEKGEGLAGMAFEVLDIIEAQSIFMGQGIEIGEIFNGTGIRDNPNEKRTWKTLYPPRTLTRGIFTILIEHTSRKYLYKESINSGDIKRLDHVVINSNDPDGAIGLYRDVYGIRLSLDQNIEDWGGRMLFFRLNKTTIEVVGKLDAKNNQDNLWGLAWSVTNIEMTYTRLINLGVDVTEIQPGRKKNTQVCTIKSKDSLIPTLIIQHD